jgi:hypothetical protein
MAIHTEVHVVRVCAQPSHFDVRLDLLLCKEISHLVKPFLTSTSSLWTVNVKTSTRNAGNGT